MRITTIEAGGLLRNNSPNRVSRTAASRALVLAPDKLSQRESTCGRAADRFTMANQEARVGTGEAKPEPLARRAKMRRGFRRCNRIILRHRRPRLWRLAQARDDRRGIGDRGR